jgi:hypothetical protein
LSTAAAVVAGRSGSARPSADLRGCYDALDAVRAVVKRWRPDDAEELEPMIAAGKLEFGPEGVE